MSGILREIFHAESEEDMLLVQQYFDLLLRWHESDNIIPSSDPDYIIKRELYDCYKFSLELKGKSFIDIGSGSGLPGILVAILNPTKEVVLLDRKRAYIDFLNLAKAQLRLTNITIIEQDFFSNECNLKTEIAIFKNFSNKRISKMDFEHKFMHLMKTTKKSKSVSKVYMLTGSPVLELSKDCLEEYKVRVHKISSPYFDTHRYIAEVHL